MLMLSRKRGEAICIGPDIVVHVSEIRGGKVRLGITAPPLVRITRPEAAVKHDRKASNEKM